MGSIQHQVRTDVDFSFPEQTGSVSCTVSLAQKHEAAGDVKPGGMVLVVDDQPFVLETMNAMLEILGCQPVLAEDGPSALRLFGQHRSEIGLVILDMKMPGMSGLDVLRALKETGNAVPVIICSGYSEDRDIEKARQEGAVDLLSKPFSLEELRYVIESAGIGLTGSSA